MSANNLPNSPIHKIGAVSSLSGVPSPTLRIWELRYGTFTPHKTESKHRLYTDSDVLKAYVELGLGVGIVAEPAVRPGRDRGLTVLPASHLFGKMPTWASR